MNNEEKILSLLDSLAQGQAKIEQGQATLVERLDRVDCRLDAMDGRFDAVDGRLERLEASHFRLWDKVQSIDNTVIRIEHEQHDKFGALFDGHALLNEKLDRLQATVDSHDSVLNDHSLNLSILNAGRKAL